MISSVSAGRRETGVQEFRSSGVQEFRSTGPEAKIKVSRAGGLELALLLSG
jgi:hypothetical protein